MHSELVCLIDARFTLMVVDQSYENQVDILLDLSTVYSTGWICLRSIEKKWIIVCNVFYIILLGSHTDSQNRDESSKEGVI